MLCGLFRLVISCLIAYCCYCGFGFSWFVTLGGLLRYLVSVWVCLFVLFYWFKLLYSVVLPDFTYLGLMVGL